MIIIRMISNDNNTYNRNKDNETFIRIVWRIIIIIVTFKKRNNYTHKNNNDDKYNHNTNTSNRNHSSSNNNLSDVNSNTNYIKDNNYYIYCYSNNNNMDGQFEYSSE